MTKFIHYALTSMLRKVKKELSRPKLINYYDKFLFLDEPTICITHDIEVGWDPNLNKVIDLEKERGIKSTFFLLNISLPSKEWIKKSQAWDLQFHSNFISDNAKSFLIHKKEVDKLIGRKTYINRSHQYVLPDVDLISKHFSADSTYNNWENITLFNPFLMSNGLVEFPVLQEIELTLIYGKDGKKVFEILKEMINITKKTNGLFNINLHPFLFKKYGYAIENFLLEQNGFKFSTLSDVLSSLKK